MVYIHLKKVLDHFELTNGRLLGILTVNPSSTYLMTRYVQSALETSGMEWPAMRNHIPCMAHIIQLALGAFMSSFGVKGRTKSWESHECDQQCTENVCTAFGRVENCERRAMLESIRCWQ